MRRIKLKKTITLGWPDPNVTICPGHVDADTFNRASAREGWNGPEGLEVDAESITHEWWQKGRKKNKVVYRQCKEGDKGAKPFTVSLW